MLGFFGLREISVKIYRLYIGYCTIGEPDLGW